MGKISEPNTKSLMDGEATKYYDDLAEGKRVLAVEAQCILEAANKLDDRFQKAVVLVLKVIKQGGKVVVTGVGKSGKIAAKVAATLTSMGTPAVFLHPTEGIHGDLGMVSSRDVLLAFSYSGASQEILQLVSNLKKIRIPLISILGHLESPLAFTSDIVMDGSVTKEACPLNLAPTSSTTVALALGDALAAALSIRLEFKEKDFATNHPGGALGKRLTLKVKDLMRSSEELPWVDVSQSVDSIIEVITRKNLGAALVRDGTEWIGLITDGDIRRALRHGKKFFELQAREVMTVKPIAIHENEKVVRAIELMENRPSQISVLPVVNDDKQCVGLVRLHDLIGTI